MITALSNSLLVIRSQSWRVLSDLNLRAHLLDLRGLLFELGCESLYLFLLLRDRCFQLLNFANFAIEHGGALVGARVRYDAKVRYDAHRCATTLARANIPAKLVGRKVRVTTTTVPPTGWKLLKIPPMKQAKDPAPFPFERSPMRIVLFSSAARYQRSRRCKCY